MAGLAAIFTLYVLLVARQERRVWARSRGLKIGRNVRVTGEVNGMPLEIPVEVRGRPELHENHHEYFYVSRTLVPAGDGSREGEWLEFESFGSAIGGVKDYNKALEGVVDHAMIVQAAREKRARE